MYDYLHVVKGYIDEYFLSVTGTEKIRNFRARKLQNKKCKMFS